MHCHSEHRTLNLLGEDFINKAKQTCIFWKRSRQCFCTLVFCEQLWKQSFLAWMQRRELTFVSKVGEKKARSAIKLIFIFTCDTLPLWRPSSFLIGSQIYQKLWAYNSKFREIFSELHWNKPFRVSEDSRLECSKGKIPGCSASELSCHLFFCFYFFLKHPSHETRKKAAFWN